MQVGFRKLKQREKNHKYSADDDDCQEAARKLIADLRELTDSGVRSYVNVFIIFKTNDIRWNHIFFSLEYFIFQLDEVLTFGVTERGIVNLLEKELKSSNDAYEKKANELEAEKTNHRESKDRYHVINMIWQWLCTFSAMYLNVISRMIHQRMHLIHCLNNRYQVIRYSCLAHLNWAPNELYPASVPLVIFEVDQFSQELHEYAKNVWNYFRFHADWEE